MYVGHKHTTNPVCTSQWLRAWKQFETLRLCPKVGSKNMYYVINFLVMKIIDTKYIENCECKNILTHPVCRVVMPPNELNINCISV
jgi:hypothetical protein